MNESERFWDKTASSHDQLEKKEESIVETDCLKRSSQEYFIVARKS